MVKLEVIKITVFIVANVTLRYSAPIGHEPSIHPAPILRSI